MTWPPADLPIDFQNATPQENTHPDAHNATNQTINADLVPEIIRVGELAETIGLYLPLTGGTLTGGLQVDGTLTVKSGGAATNVAIGFDGLDGMGIYSSIANNYMRFAVAGGQRLAIKEDVVVVNNDLQVDGVIKASKGTQSAPAITFEGATAGLYGTNDFVTTGVDGAWQHIVYKDLVRIRKDLKVDGQTLAQNGTKAKPAYSFASDTDTGIHTGMEGTTGNIEIVGNGKRLMQLGDASPTEGAWMPCISARTIGTPGNVHISPNAAQEGALYRSTASRAFMQEVEAVNFDAINSVYDLNPIWFRSTCDGDNLKHSHYGLAAEDCAAVDPRLAIMATDEEGVETADNVNTNAVIALLVAAVKEQRQQISDLTARVEALEAAS